ncbi:hypothetical protein B566_EDAN004424 [Ephemera danica]|nr:hypothetical protein B566_EDAN004424 [Ephemera danica]
MDSYSWMSSLAELSAPNPRPLRFFARSLRRSMRSENSCRIVVHIRHREVTVYPGDENKHPEGQGLNRKATVTLDRVYPTSKQNRDPITNPEAIREMDYEAVLRRKCAKMGAQFIEYRPDTGSFVFKVLHFSKYEVNEDSDSEDVQVQQQQQVAPHTPVSTMSQSQFLTPNTRYTLQGPVGDIETMDETIPEVQSPTDQLSKHANTDPCKMRLMKVSFFDSQTEELEPGYQKTMQQDFHHGLLTTMVSTPPPILGRAAAHEKLEEEMEEESTTKDQHDVRVLRPSQHPALVNACFDLFPPRITMEFTSSCADSALFMARAGSSSWGPRGSFLQIDGISINQLTPYAASPNFENWVDRHLRVQLCHTGMVAEGSRVSRRCTQPGLALLEEHCQVLNSVRDQGSQEVFIRQVLQLCLALWGSLPALQEDAKPSVVACKRKEALGEWLRDVIEAQDNTDEAMEESSLQRVMQHLNKGQLLDSVRTSQDNGEHYSALVMATAGSASTARQLLQRQLQEWVADRVSSLVNPLRLRCWLLAGAGLPLLPLEKGDTLNALQGLDWITCLAVHFWYLCSPGASIPDIVNRYEEAFSDESAYAATPVPPGGSEETLDARFHLLKLFNQRTYGLEQLLRVESHFPDHPLDTSLSWLLLVLLDSLNYTHVEEFCSQSIHLAFSEQLEAAGLWHWAIFVLQHISNPIMIAMS